MGRAYEVRKAAIAKTGAAKAKVYIMFSKEIYSAAKKGGTSIEANAVLKRLVERAKREQVPSDIINRAIDKANSGVDEDYTSVRYEGFGPGASTIIVDCLTDNVNRTVGFVRTVFNKAKAKLGVSGSVSHMYEHLCVVGFKGLTEEQVLEALINDNLDVNDIEVEEDMITVYGNPQDLYKIKTALLKVKEDLVFDLDEISMFALQRTDLEGEDLLAFKKLLELLNDVEDVQEIYHNVNLNE